jgi:hypothetical protein
MTIALLFLGQLTIQAQAFIPYLSKNGYEVTVINTAYWSAAGRIDETSIPVVNLYEDCKILPMIKGPLEWFRKAALYSVARNLNLKHTRLKQIIEKRGVELIYGSWGSLSLPEIGMTQEFHVPTVYEFLTYPTTSIKVSQKIENFFNKRIVNNLNGRVLSTQSMLYYMRNVFGIHRGENLILMECYPEKFYFRKRLPLLSAFDNQPHIVFIGMDVFDVLPQIEEMVSRKIHVHLCNLSQAGWEGNVHKDLYGKYTHKNSDFIHQFDRFTYREIADGSFATFLTQFDACLVTYNFWGASGLSRFNNSIPSRFSIALLAGIPIVIPRGYMKGCEEVVSQYQIGFAYDSYTDLRNKLTNENVLRHYQNVTIKNSKFFSLENNFAKMDNFLRRIIE